MACCATMPPLAAAQWYNTVDQACCARHLPYMERPYLVMAWLHVGATWQLRCCCALGTALLQCGLAARACARQLSASSMSGGCHLAEAWPRLATCVVTGP